MHFKETKYVYHAEWIINVCRNEDLAKRVKVRVLYISLHTTAWNWESHDLDSKDRWVRHYYPGIKSKTQRKKSTINSTFPHFLYQHSWPKCNMRVCLENQEFSRSFSTKFQDDLSTNIPGDVLPCMAYTEMCRWTGYGFLTFLGFTISCQFFPIY